VELLAEIEPLPHRPDNSIEQACFRIAQESLTNALRHARAPSQVHLQLRDVGSAACTCRSATTAKASIRTARAAWA
jgi:signal transduction histidine kinase